MKKISIIGGGATGTLLAVNLMRNNWKNQPLEINLIEKNERLGRGVAYSTATDFHLLNVPAAKMGAFPDDVEHFHRWLAENNFDFAPNAFVPRRIYGEYLRDLFRQADEQKPAKITLNRIDAEAIDVSIEGNNVETFLSSGESVASEKVVLAFGNFLPPHPKSANRAFIEAEKYVQNPWNPIWLENIKPTDDILIIGTGLTAIDVILSLFHRKHAGKIFAFSTRGLLPAVHELGHSYAAFSDELKGQTKITDLLKIVRRHIEKAEADGSNWRGVIDSLRPQTQAIWLALPEPEKRYFMQHLSRYWNVARHRMPPECAKILDEMQTANRLQILKGRLKTIETNGRFNIEYSSNGEGKKISVDAIVNCIGSESNFERLEAPLVKNLIGKGLIKSDALRLGVDATPDGKTIDADGKVSDRVLIAGTALKGILWESTAMPEIRAQAQKMAISLLE